MATTASSPTPGETSSASTGTTTTSASLATTPTVVDTVDTDLPEGVGRPPISKLEGVRYAGLSDTRSISKAEFAAVGVDARGDVSWTRDKGHLLPVEDFNAATLDYLFLDNDFEFVEKSSDV